MRGATRPGVTVRIGATRAVRIPFSLRERYAGCDFCGSSSRRTYFAYGHLRYVYCNRDCMIAHQLEALLQQERTQDAD